MIQIIRLIVIGTLVALVVSWFNKQTGESQIQWLGYEIQISTSLLVGLVIAFSVIITLFDRLWRLVRSWPKMMAHGWQYRRRTNGERALGLGLVALAAGDSRSAQKQAKKAEKLLGRGLLPDLLAAQAAHLAGDKNAARRYFAQLSKHKDTAYYGLIGIMNLQFQNNDPEKSRVAAQKALQIQPDSVAALTHIFWREVEEKNWHNAVNILVQLIPQLENLPEQKHLFQRREIALCYLLALEVSEVRIKTNWLERALKIDQSHIASRVALARIYQKSGLTKQMIKIIERGFILKPHQDHIDILQDVFSDNIGKFIARLTKLARQSEYKMDAKRLVIAASLDADILPPATSLLSEIPQNQMTNEDYLLASELAEKQIDPVGAKIALQDAARAPRGKAWRCNACSTLTAQYEPICPKCHDVGLIDWTDESQLSIKPISKLKLS